jgi:hypothetical protein
VACAGGLALAWPTDRRASVALLRVASTDPSPTWKAPFLLPFLDVKLRPSPWIRSGWRGAEVGTGGRAAGGRDRIPRNGSHELETRRRRRWRGVEEVGRPALRRQLLPRPALYQQVNPAAAPAPDSVPRLQFEIPSLLELLASLSWPLLEIPVVRLSLCSLHLGPAASGGWIPVSPWIRVPWIWVGRAVLFSLHVSGFFHGRVAGFLCNCNWAGILMFREVQIQWIAIAIWAIFLCQLGWSFYG